MQKFQPWHIGLVVLAVATLGFAGYNILRGDGIDISESVLTVDIATGDLYRIDTNGRGVMLPAKHPDTKERTLYPIYENEEGEFVIEGRGLGQIQDRELPTASTINRESGLVETDGKNTTNVNAKDLVARSS